MAVCFLQYYCGKASIATRSALGKALVRIYRDRRDSVRGIVQCEDVGAGVSECFYPSLRYFFVKVSGVFERERNCNFWCCILC